MMVHWAVPVALKLSFQSEGLGPTGVKSCFPIREHGVQVCGDQWICGYLSHSKIPTLECELENTKNKTKDFIIL